MEKIDQIHEELKNLLGYDCVIVKLQTYNDNIDEYLKIKNLLLKASDGFRTISYSKEEIDFIAKLRIDQALQAIRKGD